MVSAYGSGKVWLHMSSEFEILTMENFRKHTKDKDVVKSTKHQVKGWLTWNTFDMANTF